MEVNADDSLSHPYLMILLLVGIAGAMDAVDFREYGVFTANQAGNLVLVWERLTTDSALALLSLFSLVGCAVGVMIVILVRMGFPYFTRPSGARTLLYAASFLLIVTALAGWNSAGPVRELTAGELEIGTAPWWAAVASLSSSAMALAVMGTIFIMVGAHRAQVIAGTGPFVDSVRFALASIFTRDINWTKQFKAIVWFPVAWTFGAAFASLVPVDRGVVAAFCALTICGIAITSRRVGSLT